MRIAESKCERSPSGSSKQIAATIINLTAIFQAVIKENDDISLAHTDHNDRVDLPQSLDRDLFSVRLGAPVPNSVERSQSCANKELRLW